jgi:hypothetical protein
MPVMDQVVWASVNIASASGTTAYGRGALLPDPADPEEASTRNLLRIGGALRTVEVVYTAEELAEQMGAQAAASSARVAALDVDPTAAVGNQTLGTGEPGPPTLESPGTTPVVIGPDDTIASAKTTPGKPTVGKSTSGKT